MKPRSQPPSRADEGVAMIVAICLMLVASVVGASLMILSQTETYSSMNYTSMTQARYAAESAVHKAINYLLNAYPQPGTGADPLSNYTLTVTPVTYSGQPVVLSATPGVGFNYPVYATQTAFAAAAQGTLQAGGMTLNYSASAQLLSMKYIEIYGSPGTYQAIQTWKVTGLGSTGGSRPATVEVTAVLETQSIPFNMYGLFATAQTCGALSFSGGVSTDSYDSTNMHNATGGPVDATHPPATQSYGGAVGTNGNLTEGGGSVVNGTLSTPRTGVGNCNNGAVDALTLNGNNSFVTGGLVQLPQTVTYPTPALPSPLPGTGNWNISDLASCNTYFPGKCTGSGSTFTIDPGGAALWGNDIRITSGASVTFKPGTYNFNSVTLVGGATVNTLSTATSAVIFDIVGTGSTNPVDFSGGSVSNPTFVPERFQVLYAGTQGVQISGGTTTALMVFAPNASVSLTGGSGIYGSILGKTINDNGGTAVHYDRNLPIDFGMSSNTMLTAFNWKKY